MTIETPHRTSLILEGPLDQIAEEDIKSVIDISFGCHVSKVTINRNRVRAVVELGSEEESKKMSSLNTQNEIKIRGKTVRIKISLQKSLSFFNVLVLYLIFFYHCLIFLILW
jgi:hypothetical protein